MSPNQALDWFVWTSGGVHTSHVKTHLNGFVINTNVDILLFPHYTEWVINYQGPIDIFNSISKSWYKALNIWNVSTIVLKHKSVVRGLAQAVAMTGSDLSSSSKPWKAQYKTSFVVYEEFHEQVKWPALSLKDVCYILFDQLHIWEQMFCH